MWTSPQKERGCRGALVGIAFFLVSGALGLVGEALGFTRRGEAVVEGARAAWPSALLLAGMPFAERQPALTGEWGPAGIALRGGARARLPGPPPEPDAGPRRRRARARGRGAWELALLGVSLISGILYLRLGYLSEGNFQNDSAYYYGVARHIALSRRIEEPIVWHMVDLPPTIRHAPFDYWGGLTPLVRAPALAVFGATPHVAFLAMAAISGLSVVLFWHLVCVALPLRYRALQALTLLAFAFSSSADTYRFDTESLPVHHCVLILAMIGLATDRLLLAVVAGFLLLLNRTDGMVLFIALTFVAALRARARPGGVRRVAAAAGGLLTAYVVRNLISFRAPLPPGASAGTAIKDQWDLFALHLPRKPLSKLLLERAESAYLLQRLDLLIDDLRRQEPSSPRSPSGSPWRRSPASPTSGAAAAAWPAPSPASPSAGAWRSSGRAAPWPTSGAPSAPSSPLLVGWRAAWGRAPPSTPPRGRHRGARGGSASPGTPPGDGRRLSSPLAYPIATRLQPYTGRVRASMYPARRWSWREARRPAPGGRP